MFPSHDQDRRELEDLFFKKVREYEKRYGVRVTGIDIKKEMFDLDFKEETFNINIDVEL